MYEEWNPAAKAVGFCFLSMPYIAISITLAAKQLALKKAELILALLFIIGSILDLFFVPGTQWVMLLSAMALSSLYFYLGFALLNNIPLSGIFKKYAYQGISSLRISGAVITGFLLAITVIGVLFKFMFWKGAYVILFFTVVPYAVIIIISLIRFSKTEDGYYTGIITRVIPATIVSIILNALPSTFWVEIKYENYPYYVEALKELETNPDIIKAEMKVNAMRERMEQERGE